MKATRVKVCGITSERMIDVCIEAGATNIGFVLADSPRRVTPERAAELTRHARAASAEIQVSLVFREVEEEPLRRAAALATIHFVQANAASLARVDLSTINARAMPVYRDDEPISAANGSPLLYEGRQSGAGALADWSLAAELAATRNVFLAGGLTPDNVAAAIARVAPFGVDVSSGVESSRGVKDEGLIRRFIEQVRAADARRIEMSRGTP